ncbi:Serine dehydrogenase proteinase [Nannocystis exedens]|uniref:Serine dehydrogenase proteinase n=1 Tax=Nannocystis exedens TaxID=54 RepID=A0A1I2HTX4_9BACT|nr:hypothetical protein [Nannocystis exedens]PCC73187.1 Serine dehydrogenase proteinase [Nannocystis exedens]SFF33339.1 Serine dehydrogenase proteinase [Nannocystis exedens]
MADRDTQIAVILGLAGCFTAGLGLGGMLGSRTAARNLLMLPGRAPLRVRDRNVDPSVISIVTPVIGPWTAEDVLSQIERAPKSAVTLVLHTYGGAIGACVLIADAVRRLPRCTAVVPYMAHSGGTLIALSASTIAMGGNASLSAVDPIVRGHRARHIPNDSKHAKLRARAHEYETAIHSYVRGLLDRHLDEHEVARALPVFMGQHAPHEWPVRRDEARALGLPVIAAEKKWSTYVDGLREEESSWP